MDSNNISYDDNYYNIYLWCHLFIYLFFFNPHIVTFNSINVILDSKNISMRVITSHLLVTLYILVLFKFLILVITHAHHYCILSLCYFENFILITNPKYRYIITTTTTKS